MSADWSKVSCVTMVSLVGWTVAMVCAALQSTSGTTKKATPRPPPGAPREEEVGKWLLSHTVLGALALTVYLTVFMDCASTTLLVPLVPYLCRSLGASVPQMGLAIAASQLTQVPGSMLLGLLADKYDCKTILVLSVVLYGITYLNCGLATEYWQLFLACFFTGIFSATFVLCLLQLAQTTPKEHHAAVMGICSIPAGAAHLLAPAMSGLLSVYSYSAPLFVSAGLCWFNALSAHVFLPSSGVEEEAPGGAPSPALADALKLLVQRPMLVLVCVVLCCDQACFVGIVGMATAFFQDVFGMPSAENGFVLGIGGTGMLLGALLTGFVTRRLGSAAIIALASSLRALANFVLVGIRSERTAWVLFTVCLGVEPWLLGSLLAMVDELVPPRNLGSAFGYVGAFRGCGIMLGTLGGSFLYSVDINLPFIVFGVCQLALGPALLVCLGLGLLVGGREKK